MDRARRRRHRRGRLDGACRVERIGGVTHSHLRAPEIVKALIHAQPIEPRPERGLTPEGSKLPVRVQKDFLKEVLCLLRRPDQANRQTVEAPGVGPVQLLEGGRVAVAASLRKLQVGASHVCWGIRRGRGTGGLLPVGPR